MKFSPGRLMIALFVSITISGLAGLDLSSSLILAGVFYLVFTKLFATPNNVGKEAYCDAEFLEFVQGKRFNMSEGVHVVEFWATWCPPCRKSVPHLNSLYESYCDVVNFVGITKEKREVVSPFIEKMGGDMTYPVALDGSSRFHKAYSVRSLPAAFVIKDGVIVWAGHPMSEALETQMVEALGGEDNL